MNWNGVNGDQDLHNNIDYLERKLALAEKTIAALRHAGGRPIDQAWVEWRQAIIDYDAAKEAL